MKLELRLDDKIYDGSVTLRQAPVPEPIVDAYKPTIGQTVADMLKAIGPDGPAVIALPEGRWELGTVPSEMKRFGPKHQIEIVGIAPGAVIHQTGYKPWRPWNKIAYKNLTVDFTDIMYFYDNCVGFDGCLWASARGWVDEGIDRRYMVRDPNYYFKNGEVRDCKYGPTHAAEVANSKIYKISGDVFQHSRYVHDCDVDLVDGTILSHHTDLFQLWQGVDGHRWENIRGTNFKGVQNFMLQSWVPGKTDATLVVPFEPEMTINGLIVRNVHVDQEAKMRDGKNWGGPPWSQMQGYYEDCLFENVHVPNQRLMIRPPIAGQPNCRNVIFRNCGFHPESSIGSGAVIETTAA